METLISVRHQSLKINAAFETFTDRFEKRLGRYDASVFQQIKRDPTSAIDLLKKVAGQEDFMLFEIQDHGKLLHMVGAQRKAKQYVVGNPLIAVQMTRHNIRAGLYAPLRVLVFEDESGSLIVEYDLPSSLFGQFNDAAVDLVAQGLDEKLNRLINTVEMHSAS